MNNNQKKYIMIFLQKLNNYNQLYIMVHHINLMNF